MRKLIDAIYRGTTMYNHIECDVYEQIYEGGDIWFDLVPIEEDYLDFYFDML